MRIVKLILIVLGIAGIALFIMPVVTHRLVNAGSITGMVISAVLLLYGIRFDAINQFVGQLVQSTPGKVVVGIVGALIVAYVVLVAVASVCMVRADYVQPQRNAAAIVLGCKVRGEQPSLMLAQRCDAAIDYLQQNPGTVAVLSGGQGQGESISEAECMRRYIVAAGIDPSRLIIEDKSTSTAENIRFSKQLLQQYGLGTNVAIVTHEFHEYRACTMATQQGLQAGAVPASSPWWLLAGYWLREVWGIAVMWVT